jgi:uncharacterized protein (TIGR03118 family)
MQQSAMRRCLAKAKDHSPMYLKLKMATPWFAGLLVAAIASCGLAQAQTAGVYQVTNIISDGSVPATTMDPSFIDPWGVSGTNTLWIDTNVTGFSYLSSIAGVPGSFKAVVPAASGTGTGQPTGTVQNTTTGFILSDGTKASFLFATLDGTISGWNSGTSAGGNHALIAVNNSASNAVYPDLALVANTTGSFLLVPNFGQGSKVEIYNTSFQPATLAGTFTDPNVPAGYAPYAIKVLGTQVFVTYMLRTTPPFSAGAGTYQEILGTNTGFVSVFDVNGNFVARVVTGGNLNAPWGVAIAPAGFGIYGGDLLIGNFGDGLITAYSPNSPYAYLGMVADGTGKAIAYPGLWDIFVSPATAANPNAIYFTAGIGGEQHGLFGVIANSTTASSTATFNVSTSSQVASVSMGSSTSLTISVVPTNSFAGTVTLGCSGLPAGATCSFSPNQLTVSSTAPATATVTIQTSGSVSNGYFRAALGTKNLHGNLVLASTLMLPFGSLIVLGCRKRLIRLRLLGVVTLLFVSAGLIAGCGSSAPGTPAGTSNVIIMATSGSITQSSTVALTVQ